MEVVEILEMVNELSAPVMSIIAIIIAFVRTRKKKTAEEIIAKQKVKAEKAKTKFEKELNNYNNLKNINNIGGENSNEISNN